MPIRTKINGAMPNKEKRSIHKHWLQRYFFYQNDDILTCLICKKNIRVPKKYNIQRHYKTYHQDYEQYTGDIRRVKVSELISVMREQLGNSQLDIDSDFVCVVPKQENDDDSYLSSAEQPEIDIFTKEESLDLTNTSKETELKLFGQYIGEKLLCLNSELRSWAKREICEIIYKAEIKQLRAESENIEENTTNPT